MALELASDRRRNYSCLSNTESLSPRKDKTVSKADKHTMGSQRKLRYLMRKAKSTAGGKMIASLLEIMSPSLLLFILTYKLAMHLT